MLQFEFADFIDEFKVDFTAYIPQPGSYDDAGKWIVGETVPTPLQGIIMPYTSPGYSDGNRYDPNGVVYEAHRKIYTTTKIPNGTKIEYNGGFFTIDSGKDFGSYADVFIYVAKGVKK